jgi:hypothetical protein
MFCQGSNTSATASTRAVSGMSCMRPSAPRRETARGLNADSAAITALMSATGRS